MLASKVFVDAKELLLAGVGSLEPGQMVHMPHFNLMDAMNAIEIMDPRMDSGASLPSSTSAADEPVFDPQRPLLPEEVCWILDRAMACEMAYHTGLTLSQTVYTVLHLHPSSLAALDPASLAQSPHFLSSSRPQTTTMTGEADDAGQRPVELLGLVLRAGLMGLAKSTGIVWDELMKGNLYDGEDFMGDKAGLEALLEADDPLEILLALEQAIDWLSSTPSLDASEEVRQALLARLTFRATLLRSLTEVVGANGPGRSGATTRPTAIGLLRPLLVACRSATPPLRSSLRAKIHKEEGAEADSVEPPSAACKAAFDPSISRRLVSHVPLAVVELGPTWRAEAWERMAELVDGLVELIEVIWDKEDAVRGDVNVGVSVNKGVLSGRGGGGAVLGWRNVVGWLDHLHLIGVTPARPQPSAFLRSIMLSVFYQPDDNTIFNFTKLGHLSSLFFAEVAGVPLGVMRELVELSEEDRPLRRGEAGEDGDDCGGWGDGRRLSELVNVFCQRVDGFLVNSAMNLGQNRARSKRLAGKGTSQWEELYDEAVSLVPLCQERLRLARYPEELVTSLANVPLAIALHRLVLVEHSLLAGFQLELYAAPDLAMVWWALHKAFAKEASLWARLSGLSGTGSDGETSGEVGGLRDRRCKVAAGWAAVCSLKFQAAVGLSTTSPGEATLDAGDVADKQLYARFISRFKHLLPPPPPPRFAFSSSSSSRATTNTDDDDHFVPTWSGFQADLALVKSSDWPAAANEDLAALADRLEQSSAELEELLPGAPTAYLELSRDMDARLATALRSDKVNATGYSEAS